MLTEKTRGEIKPKFDAVANQTCKEDSFKNSRSSSYNILAHCFNNTVANFETLHQIHNGRYSNGPETKCVGHLAPGGQHKFQQKSGSNLCQHSLFVGKSLGRPNLVYGECKSSRNQHIRKRFPKPHSTSTCSAHDFAKA